jgi:hypothetical protein
VCSYGCVAFLWARPSPSFATLSAYSLPSMLTCALTLYNVIGWERFWSNCTMEASVAWSGWLLYNVGCLICVFSRYSTFRLSVNKYAGSFGHWVVIIRSVL